MQRLSYSVVIPTRNRQKTAIFAIESVLRADYPFVQVVVADNSDTDTLYQDIKNRDWHNRITYVKTSSVLSMRANWELGLEAVTGEIISVIGDDDAIMPDAFLVANLAFSKVPIDVLHSSQAIYKWDSYPFKPRRQYLSFSLGDNLTQVKDPKSLLRAAYKYSFFPGTGPGLYYGFVKKEYLDNLKSSRGSYIVDLVPDFDSGYCTLMYANSYATSARPLFIQGHSGFSNSGSMRYASAISKNRDIFVDESGLDESATLNEDLAKIKSVNAEIVSAQLRFLPEARRALADDSLELNKEAAWDYLAEGIRGGYDKVQYLVSIQALLELGHRWGVSEAKLEITGAAGTTKGLPYEQGFFYRDKKNSKKTTGSEGSKSGDGYSNMVINGRVAKFKNILDAVDFVQSVFPSLLASPGLVEECLAVNARKSEVLLTKGQEFLDKNMYEEAIEVIESVLTEDSTNQSAYLLLEQAFLSKGSQTELCRLYEDWFSIHPNQLLLAKLLKLYKTMGFENLADDMTSGLLLTGVNQLKS